jgi:hypothetical protein
MMDNEHGGPTQPVVLLDTRNALDWNGNGGDHRALQVAELVRAAGCAVRVPPMDAPTTFFERHLRGIAVQSTKGYPIHLARDLEVQGRQALSNAGHVAKRYEDVLAGAPVPSLFLWEGSDNVVGAGLARRAGCPVWALPQNIYTAEKGWRDFWLGRRGLAALEMELRFLRRCEAVFTISREEQWLLRLQGVDADHLPYYPPSQLEAFLLQVRRDRRPGRERRFLLLGSATHPPTRSSLQRLIATLVELPESASLLIDVAGFGTEELEVPVSAHNVVLHGSVDQARLADLLAMAGAAIVEQRPSVGALTKIPELLMAGVPVIANVDASRSTWSLEGIVHYESLSDLQALLEKPLPAPPVPPRPQAAEERFQSRLDEVVSRHR